MAILTSLNLWVMTVFEAVKLIQAQLAEASDSPQTEAYRMLEGLTCLSRTELTLNRQQVLSKRQVETMQAWIERRLNREPLQHILGAAPFYGLELKVTPDVFIPRPETERLVELALEDMTGLSAPRILDVGTGSGAVALALKHERPDAFIMAAEVSEAALTVAKANAKKLGLGVDFVVSDLLADAEVKVFAQHLDVLVANLPYLPDSDREDVSPEVKRDPNLALYSGPDGLEHFRNLEVQAYELLKPGTLCWLELDPRNVTQAAKFSRRWTEVNVFNDLANRKRFLRLKR